MVVTDCITGEAVYYEKHELGEDYLTILRASSSLPFISKPVKYKGRVLMDGGMSDSIPIQKSMAEGNKKNVIVLTQPKGYRKKPESLAKLASLRYPHFKGLRASLENRHVNYNETMDFIDALESKEEVFVIRPESALSAGRVERNKAVLYADYDRGYADAQTIYNRLLKYLS